MLVAACSLGISVHWVGHRPTSTSGYKMKLHVFVDVIVVGGGGGGRGCLATVYVNFDVATVPDNYDGLQCYLCANVYQMTRMWGHVEHHPQLAACEHCVYTNFHKLREWQPLFDSFVSCS